MAAPLRLVLCDTAAVDADTALSARALEACARAGVEIVMEPALDPEAVLAEWTATGPETIAVGATLAAAPVSAVWVGPDDLEVRGENVRVAEDGDELLYEAVITELAERR
jgi:hypothetical protein